MFSEDFSSPLESSRPQCADDRPQTKRANNYCTGQIVAKVGGTNICVRAPGTNETQRVCVKLQKAKEENSTKERLTEIK